MQALEQLWDDGELLLARRMPDDGRPSVLLSVPSLAQCRPGAIRHLEDANAPRDQLDPAWLARPLSLAQHDGRTLLLLRDPTAIAPFEIPRPPVARGTRAQTDDGAPRLRSRRRPVG